MDTLLLLKSLVMGVVEGLTEFLPVSSLGHVIIVGDLLHFPTNISATFEIFVQIGALIALLLYFAHDLLDLLGRIPSDPGAQRLLVSLGIAFLPAAIIGFVFGDALKRALFHPTFVAVALVVGGILMLLVERRMQSQSPVVTSVETVDGPRALSIGFSQVLALWPGMSRSAPTICGGLLCSLDRVTALRFSFYLAIPTLLAASALDFVRSLPTLSLSVLPVFLIGAFSAFIVALIVIRFFLGYIAHHGLRPFAWYRIVVGVLMLAWYTLAR